MSNSSAPNSNKFSIDRSLLEFDVSDRRVERVFILCVFTLACTALFAAALPAWAAALSVSAAASLAAFELHQLNTAPDLIRHLPDGSWEGVWLPKSSLKIRIKHQISAIPQKTTKKLILTRHFFYGSRSISLIFRDSGHFHHPLDGCRKGSLLKARVSRNTCPCRDWRRLKVLLRWSPATPADDRNRAVSRFLSP